MPRLVYCSGGLSLRIPTLFDILSTISDILSALSAPSTYIELAAS